MSATTVEQKYSVPSVPHRSISMLTQELPCNNQLQQENINRRFHHLENSFRSCTIMTLYNITVLTQMLPYLTTRCRPAHCMQLDFLWGAKQRSYLLAFRFAKEFTHYSQSKAVSTPPNRNSFQQRASNALIYQNKLGTWSRGPNFEEAFKKIICVI